MIKIKKEEFPLLRLIALKMHPIEVTTTNVGDKDKKILDTGDISRASIAAADIVKGTTKAEDAIHIPQISAY